MPGECDQQGKRGVEDGGLNLTPPGRQAGLTRSHPTPPNPPQSPPPELRSALQGCLRSLSVQGVNQPITRLQMPAVKETSQAPGKGPINKTQAPFGLFLYTEKLLVSISFLSFFFFLTWEDSAKPLHFYVIEKGDTLSPNGLQNQEWISSGSQPMYVSNILLLLISFRNAKNAYFVL